MFSTVKCTEYHMIFSLSVFKRLNKLYSDRINFCNEDLGYLNIFWNCLHPKFEILKNKKTKTRKIIQQQNKLYKEPPSLSLSPNWDFLSKEKCKLIGWAMPLTNIQIST